jgi:hypothetical protein
MKKQIKVILSALIIFLVVVICALNYEKIANKTTSKELTGTIAFTLKDAEKGLLSGTFERNGYTISFDVVRTKEENPDVRICDEKKYCFSSQVGGATFANPSWGEDNSEGLGQYSDFAKNFETAWALHQKLIEMGSADFIGLKEEYLALGDISNNQPNQSDQELKESLAAKEVAGTITFTTKDPEKGLLSGTFENNGYTIRFDVARGGENPMIMRVLSDNTPHYSIDVRVCDEKKFCFAQQAGGDSFADPNFVQDNSEENGPDNERAAKNFETLWVLHQKLIKMGPTDFAGLTEEYDALVSMSNDPPDQWQTIRESL